MAEQPKADLEEVALRLYCETAARTNRGGQQLALESFHRAEAFIAVRDRIAKAGLPAVKKAETSILADVHCPKLPDTHPYNLVSQVKGNLDTVNRVHAWLEKNSGPTTAELVGDFNSAFRGFGWDAPQINVARQIFPKYAAAAK